MKTVNPVGRTPNNSEMNAYGCTCSISVGNYSSVSGNVPCNVCAYSCAGTDNLQANQSQSQNRMTHS